MSQRHPETEPEADVDHRLAFIKRVGEVFSRAGVHLVVLHARGPIRTSDSDVDVAVRREHLGTVDAIARTGVLGRLVQRIDYDVPWARFYIFESDEPQRRYRQLDLASDPWGIGRYGPAHETALNAALTANGLPVPAPAAETLYLVVKRAQKGVPSVDVINLLRLSFAKDPDGSRRLLEAEFGPRGREMAAAFAASDQEVVRALERIATLLARRRRTPGRLARRSWFGASRIARRVANPTGFVICLVGPDGVGKSTLAASLEREASGAFRNVVRLHSRPSLLPQAGRVLGRPAPDSDKPHTAQPSGTPLSLIRLAYLWLDFAVGWWPRVAIPRISSTLVILERGWLDLAVDPKRYRLSIPTTLTRHLGRLLAQPDLTIVLDAPAGSVVDRKAELTKTEVKRQSEAWHELASENPTRFVITDASKPASSVHDEVLDCLNDRLAARTLDLSDCTLALECMGDLVPDGKPHSIIEGSDGPRWILPAGRGGWGPMRRRLYRPASAIHLARALAIEGAQWAGGRGRRIHRTRMRTEGGLAPKLAVALALSSVDVAAAHVRSDESGKRVVLSVFHEGALVAFAKVAEGKSAKLRHERHVLDALARAELRRVAVPTVIDFLQWRGHDILLTDPVDTRGRANRPFGAAEIAALAELTSLTDDLSRILGEDISKGGALIHGDFTPWNCAELPSGGLSVWDWEDAQVGLPLEDFFHWVVQRLVLFGEGSPNAIVEEAVGRSRRMEDICSALGVTTEDAPIALAAYLERTVKNHEPGSRGSAIRETTLAALRKLVGG